MHELASTQSESGDIFVRWKNEQYSRFPFRWLRYECSCSHCGDSTTGIRFLTLAELPKILQVESCSLTTDNKLRVVWSPTKHESLYDGNWLWQHRLDPNARETRVHKPTTWGSELETTLPTYQFDDYLENASTRCDVFEAIRDLGLAKLVNGPDRVGTCEQVAAPIGPLEETYFGRIFDLKSSENAESVGGTRHPATLHTDDSYLNHPTGLKIIHCIRPGDNGTGLTLFVDGFRLGEKLTVTAPKAFEILSTIPLTFNRRYKKAILVAKAPVFSCDTDGRITGFRFQDRSMAPLSAERKKIEQVLDAIVELMALIDEPENQIKLRLLPGDAVLFDNQRVLHGRTGFSGPRHLQLCSVSRDAYISEMRVLQHTLNREGPYQFLASGARP